MHRKEANARLETMAEWELSRDASAITRSYQFPDYAQALAFVQRVSAAAEEMGHHPDIAFGWGYAYLELSTHSIQGLSEGDFALAEKINALG